MANQVDAFDLDRAERLDPGDVTRLVAIGSDRDDRTDRDYRRTSSTVVPVSAASWRSVSVRASPAAAPPSAILQRARAGSGVGTVPAAWRGRRGDAQASSVSRISTSIPAPSEPDRPAQVGDRAVVDEPAAGDPDDLEGHVAIGWIRQPRPLRGARGWPTRSRRSRRSPRGSRRAACRGPNSRMRLAIERFANRALITPTDHPSVASASAAAIPPATIGPKPTIRMSEPSRSVSARPIGSTSDAEAGRRSPDRAGNGARTGGPGRGPSGAGSGAPARPSGWRSRGTGSGAAR